MEEHKLVRRAMRGDREAFSALVGLHQRSVYGAAYGITRSEWDAADAAQETFAEAFDKIGTLRDPRRFRAWVSRILVNKCNEAYRRSKSTISMAEVPEPRAVHEFVGPEEGLDLMAAVQMLDDDHRTVVVLRYFRDMKVDDIAEVLGCPAGTVKSRLNRALAKLNAGMRQQEGGREREPAVYLEVAR